MSLPRVATLPPTRHPRSRVPPPGLVFDGSALHRPSQADSNQIGSILFPEHPTFEPPRMRASAAFIHSTSLDHPLALIGQGMGKKEKGAEEEGREVSALEQAGLAAGRVTDKSPAMGSVLSAVEPAARRVRDGASAPRHEYQHPTYQIERSSHSAIKGLIYGEDDHHTGMQLPPHPPAGCGEAQDPRVQAQPSLPAHPSLPCAPSRAPLPDHPLSEVYSRLREEMRGLPRPNGCTDETALAAALQHSQLQLSVDGFAELLARCDVSAEGFPEFETFVGCVNRPHREGCRPSLPPPEEGSPAIALLQSEEWSEGKSAVAEEEPELTWRQLQVREQLENRKSSVSFSAQEGEGAGEGEAEGRQSSGLIGPSHREPPRSSFPLGFKSQMPMLGLNMASDPYCKKRHVTSNKFTKSFHAEVWY
ncbi:MAG: hypothetical protein SGPRY_005097 [Prymnesium sp.]